MRNKCKFKMEDGFCDKKTRLGFSYCNYCKKHYCAIHYQLETHNCPNLTLKKEQCREQLKRTLLSSKPEANKIIKI